MLKPLLTILVIADGSEQKTIADSKCPADDCDGTLRLKLFFILALDQRVPVLILANSRSVRNLISKTLFWKQTFKPVIGPIADEQVVTGN